MGMYYLGIDVGKYEHQATLLNERHERIGESIRFKNTHESFQEWMQQIKKSVPASADITAGMESTGHYWINLRNFLKATGITNIQVINPIETQQVSTTRVRKVKNDKVDSLTIAQIISRSQKRAGGEDDQRNALKRLTRFYDKMKRQETFVKRELNSLLELICPEFEGLFKNMFLKTPLAILRTYTDLRTLLTVDVAVFCALLTKESRGRITSDRAVVILQTVQHSIGQHHWDAVAVMQLRMLLDTLELMQTHIIELQREIEQASDHWEDKHYLVSIPGVSSISAAIYLAELGDISKFHTKHQLTAFAGIDASVCESGTYKRTQGNHISKRGSKYLRKQLYYAAKTAVIFDPELKAYYVKKKHAGKHYNVIMIAVARKLLRRMYVVMKQKRVYEVRSYS